MGCLGCLSDPFVLCVCFSQVRRLLDMCSWHQGGQRSRGSQRYKGEVMAAAERPLDEHAGWAQGREVGLALDGQHGHSRLWVGLFTGLAVNMNSVLLICPSIFFVRKDVRFHGERERMEERGQEVLERVGVGNHHCGECE